MAQKISVGIDIGSAVIKVIVAESSKENDKQKPRVVGVGYAHSEGMRHGYIINPDETAKSLRQAITQAQKTSGYKIEKGYFGIGGAGLEGVTESALISFGEKEITISQNDIDQALEECQNELPASDTRNREIIHSIPLAWKIDNKPIYGKPQGMVASSLEVKAFFVTALSQHLSSILATARYAGLEIEDIVASPVAASVALLSKSQQIAGCGLLIIGAETSSFSIFENSVPIAVDVMPIGSRDITNDIALGFKVSLEEAERIKISRIESLPYPRRKIEEVVKARLEDICDFVQAVLKKNGRQGLLPAGILVTGGGAQSSYIEELAKEKLKLPVKKIGVKFDGESKVPLSDATWVVAYGLAVIGGEGKSGTGIIDALRGGGVLSRITRAISRFFKKILP